MKHADRTTKFASFFTTLAVVILAISANSCGNKESSLESGDDAPAARSGGRPVDAATAGSVTGTIWSDGVPPRMKTINMIDVPNCAKMHPTPALTEGVVPSDNGTLQNVVVYLQGDFSPYSFPATDTSVKVHQEGCLFSPHIVAVMTGEPLEIANADSTTHNINAISQYRQGWNETQSPGAAPIVRRFAREEIALAVKCNVHPWMRFYVAVLSHPYFQITRKDGQFALRNVPPGNYTLAA
jgi:plastocyanin